MPVLNELDDVSLPPASEKLSKADEIKKAIASIAGPTGTLPLFPSEKKCVSEPLPVKDVQPLSRSYLDKRPVALAPKSSQSFQKQSDSISHTSDIFPHLKSISSSSLAEKPGNNDKAEFSSVRLKKIDPLLKQGSHGSVESNEEPVFSSKSLKKVNLKNPVENENDNEPPLNLPKQRNPSSSKKVPPTAPVKPRSLSSQKKSITSNDSTEENPKNGFFEATEEDVDKEEEKAEEKPEKETSTRSLENEEKEPEIISPLPTSLSSGLRKAQTTSSHNIHDKVSGTVHGRVPLPGMASNVSHPKPLHTSKLSSDSITLPSLRPTNVFHGQSSPNRSPSQSPTRSLTQSPTRSPTHSPCHSAVHTPTHSPSRQTLRPNLSPSAVDLRPSASSLNPAGSFLATRASTIVVPRPKSPTRGGFVQSAMLKREGTVTNRPRADSASGNIFDGIMLANPSSNKVNLTGSRSPSPTRHARTQSATNIESYHSLKTLSPPNLQPVNQGEDSKEFEEFEDGEDSEENKKHLSSPPRSARNSDERGSPRSSVAGSLKATDSRRWSPVKQTWLGSALMKNSPSSPPDPSPNMSRMPTVIRAPSPTRHNRGNSLSTISTGKLTFPVPPPSRPPLHNVALSEPLWIEKDDAGVEYEEKNPAKPEPPKPRKTLEGDSCDKLDTPPSPPPSRPMDESNSTSFSKPAPKPPGNFSSSLSRNNTIRPAVPKKPDLISKLEKPTLPSDALEKLRALRSGVQSSQNSKSPSSESELDQVKASLRRSNTLQFKPSRSIRNGPRPVPPKSLVSRGPSYFEEENEDDEDEEAPPLPIRPSQRSYALHENNIEDDEEVEPPRLPPRKHVVSRTTGPLPPVPDSLAVRNHIETPDPITEARKFLYGPSNEEKEADESFYSGTPNIPNFLNKKTAKSFATDLSEVLSRGKPASRSQPSSQPGLTSLDDTTKSFSPRFERMAGLKKSHTFDFDGPSNGKGGDENENKKVELKHMTKGRARGPRGRKLPKNIKSTPVSGASTPREESDRFRKAHQRQRSRSLSPDFAKRLSHTTATSNTLPLVRKPKNFVIEKQDKATEDDDDLFEIPTAPPSRALTPSSNDESGVLLISKTRKTLPPPPAALQPGHSRPGSPIILSPVGSSMQSGVTVARQKPVIRKSSQSVSKGMAQNATNGNTALVAQPVALPLSSNEVLLPNSPIQKIARKPVKPAPAKPRKPSSSVHVES